MEAINMVYGYIRVSTDKQDCATQKLGIERKAESLGLAIERYIEDSGISGTIAPEARALGGCLRRLRAGDIIICSELSRLGRKMFMIMRVLEWCMACGAMLYTVKDNYVLGDNIQSKVLAFAFGIAAEIERDLISMRTKEGLAHRRAQGHRLGRPYGAKNRSYKLDTKCDIIVKMRASGKSKRAIARQLHVSIPTINRWITRHSMAW